MFNSPDVIINLRDLQAKFKTFNKILKVLKTIKRSEDCKEEDDRVPGLAETIHNA